MTSEKSYDVEQRFNAHLAAHLSSSQGTSPPLGSSMTTCLSAVLPAAAQYTVQGQLLLNSLTSGGTLSYRAHATGGLTITGTARFCFYEMNGTNSSVTAIALLEGTATGSTVGGGLADRAVLFSGTITVAVPGTLNIQAAVSSGSVTAYAAGSHIDVWQNT